MGKLVLYSFLYTAIYNYWSSSNHGSSSSVPHHYFTQANLFDVHWQQVMVVVKGKIFFTEANASEKEKTMVLARRCNVKEHRTRRR